MTPDQLAEKQLLAAWVSAAAAVVQAVGALGAIFASIWLARSSQKREDAAREASAQRERDADAAAERRAREADEAAERRSARAFTAQREAREADGRRSHDDMVDRAVDLATKALALLDSQIEEWDGKVAADVRTNWGAVGFGSVSLLDIRKALGLLRDECVLDTDLNLAISKFLSVSDPTHHPSTTGLADIQASTLRKVRTDWIVAIDGVKICRIEGTSEVG